MIVFDSYAWLEYFLGSERGTNASRYIESGEKIVTPDIVLAEIAKKYIRDGIGASEVKKRLYYISSQSEIESIDAELSLGAAQAWRELTAKARKRKIGSPGLADGLVLATARRRGTKVLTADRHFEGIAEVIIL